MWVWAGIQAEAWMYMWPSIYFMYCVYLYVAVWIFVCFCVDDVLTVRTNLWDNTNYSILHSTLIYFYTLFFLNTDECVPLLLHTLPRCVCCLSLSSSCVLCCCWRRCVWRLRGLWGRGSERVLLRGLWGWTPPGARWSNWGANCSGTESRPGTGQRQRDKEREILVLCIAHTYNFTNTNTVTLPHSNYYYWIYTLFYFTLLFISNCITHVRWLSMCCFGLKESEYCITMTK